ncbi:MAG: DMT family transporter [Bacteroidales bacterium]|nr:DMT family transporter [Bacteroidales bacterium]MBR0170925.1 DMT family transporter [Bacteroidales bacterium]
MKNQIAIGHLACAAAYVIFGINVVVCRDIATDGGIAPIVLFSMRALVAGALFWLASLFTKKEKVPWKDLLRLAGAGFLGLFMPQLTFLHAIAHTTPVDLSVMSTTTPIFTMFVAAIFLKEPITWKKAFGVALSFGGILWLILQSTFGGNGASETEPIGIAFCFANYIVFALYLGTCRKLIARYSVVTSMKWMFLVSFIISIPFTVPHLPSTDFMAVPSYVWWEIGFMIIFSTFIAYYLIPVGQKRIRPTLVSMYGYLQPIIAIAVAIWTGMDRLTFTKILAAMLVFTGVWVVNQSRAAMPPPTKKE